MKLLDAWDDCGLPPAAWAELSLRFKADVARRLRGQAGRRVSLLRWGRRFLSAHFRRAPSGMHVWLSEQFDAMTVTRGTKINVIGPRGGAKSTVATLAYALRAAVDASSGDAARSTARDRGESSVPARK